MNRRLIVNADDFGWSPEVNAGIVRGHCGGVLTSATLMVNAPGFEDALAQARRAPSLGVGLHLNLTQGRPASPPDAVPSLVGADGCFLPVNRLVRSLLCHRIPAGELDMEIRAQLREFREHLGEPTHLDSHKHIHVFGVLPHVLGTLAREFRQPRIRCPLERMRPAVLRRPSAALRLMVLHLLGGRARRVFAQSGYAMPDRFVGIADTGFLTAASCARLLEHLTEGTTEFMCHPGDPPNQASGPTFETRLVAARPAELQAVMDPSLVPIVKRRQIDLVSYAAL